MKDNNIALIRELSSKILNENGKILNAKLKLIELIKQLDKLKGE